MLIYNQKAKGYDTRKHILACFGGAGGQHACSIARSLGIKKIAISRFAGILSALGMSMADVVVEKQEPCNLDLSAENVTGYISQRVDVLKQECVQHLINHENFKPEAVETEVYLNLRYQGTDTGIMCSRRGIDSDSKLVHTDFEQIFVNK